MEFDLLKEIIAEVLNVDTAEIKESTTFVDDLGADSLDVFQIIMGVEEKLNIEVDTDAAEKLSTVAGDHQVICITHLPQIAAMADAHYAIEKKVVDGKTKTMISLLNKEQEIAERLRKAIYKSKSSKRKNK